MSDWPPLPLASWKATCDTLHMWTQIVGKVRLELSPHVNHWWQVPLYVTARGLTTSAIPYRSEIFEIRFDFLDQELVIETSNARVARMPLEALPVAEFYRRFMERLAALGIEVRICAKPVEVPDPIPFADDYVHAAYDPEFARRFWRVLITTDTILKQFRSPFVGKCSPVHFFWGSFDLALTKFSGRPAPERPGADPVTREAYSHEVISAGFWPGGGEVADAAFYSYTAPVPPGLENAAIRPPAAIYHKGLNEFLFMYEDARRSASPREALLEFLQTTYDAGANLAHWDRHALERRMQSVT